MPELPEVETIRRSLAINKGASITSLDIFRPEVVRRKDFELEEIYGQIIINIKRRGKSLVLVMKNRLNLVVHLGMSGRFYMMNEDDLITEPHVHVVIHLDNDCKLVYQDARRFGGVRLVKDINQFFKHLGYEPLSPHFNAACLGEILKNRRVAIKSLLLNQNLIAGIGNIYADEALFGAGIRPDRPAGSLNEVEITRLCSSIKKVLKTSIRQRGTTFRDYRDGYNRAGSFQNSLKVYGRAGEPCLLCGDILKKDRIGGRGTHFCERCQK